MIYYLHEERVYNEKAKVNATAKARLDAEKILSVYERFTVAVPMNENPNPLQKVQRHFRHASIWKKELNKLEDGSTLIMQFPLTAHTVFFSGVVKKMRKKKIKIILLLHDLDTLRLAISGEKSKLGSMRINMEEKDILEGCDAVIAHNPSMIEQLVKTGINRDKIVSLGIFDYLLDGKPNGGTYGEPIIIAGNLEPKKAGYIYHLPGTPEYNLYGMGYDAKADNIHYFGAFPPDDLPFIMHGSFGLVWDGNSVETCSGAYGEYLKINNPHKTSLYLACGIPVIIWSQAALAPFILENNVGIVVDSLNDIPTVSPEDYAVMRENAEKIGAKLRRGEMLKTAVEKCL